MNYNCKYCDYVDKCSRRCEYDSILCRINRSFPKVVERPYKEVLYENSELKVKQEYFIKWLEDNIKNCKKYQKYLYEKENTKLVDKAYVNGEIGTYQGVLDKFRGVIDE